MAVWSSFQKAGASSMLSLCKNGQLMSLRGLKTSPIQLSGHGNHMEIKPSSWQWNKFKDFFHFYFMVGAIPCLSIVFLTNVFIGPATLTEIPEGYTPQHWECHKHPITRFIAKYFHPSPQEVYEKKMDRLYEIDESNKIRTLTEKIDLLMSERLDQQVYYYKPVYTNHFQMRREEAEKFRDEIAGTNQ